MWLHFAETASSLTINCIQTTRKLHGNHKSKTLFNETIKKSKIISLSAKSHKKSNVTIKHEKLGKVWPPSRLNSYNVVFWTARISPCATFVSDTDSVSLALGSQINACTAGKVPSVVTCLGKELQEASYKQIDLSRRPVFFLARINVPARVRPQVKVSLRSSLDWFLVVAIAVA